MNRARWGPDLHLVFTTREVVVHLGGRPSNESHKAWSPPKGQSNMISTYRYRTQPDVAVGDAPRVAQGDGTDWSARAEMVRAIRQIVLRGDVRWISIADGDGKTLIEVPHLLGSRAGPRMDLIWAAVDALARVAGRLTIRVDREVRWPVRTGPAETRAAITRTDLVEVA